MHVCTCVCSWHVLSRDNIARVQKDEAEARALEAKKAEKVALAVSGAGGPGCVEWAVVSAHWGQGFSL